ncbi:MAG: diguanylate cyclase [Pseudomonadota bacterium]
MHQLLPPRDGKAGLVLTVDDDPICTMVMENCLQDEFDILCAGSGEEALALVASHRPDLVLLDVLMPGLDGYQVCARLKANSATSHIPIIFLTAQSDLASETRGLELGAVDYLSKPFTPSLVRARVRNHVELKRARDRLTAMAMVDGLTGLANRRQFDAALDAELRRLSRTEGSIGLLLLDVDHFKLFNDTYGHLEGDDCLRRVAQTMKACLARPFDLAARYGGEEFACILPETDLAGAVGIAQQILDAIAGLAIPHARSSAAGHVTASIGVAAAHFDGGAGEGDAVSAKALVKAADEQLYQAKETGRARVRGTRYE